MERKKKHDRGGNNINNNKTGEIVMELTQIWRSIECHLFAYLRLLRLRLFFLFPRRSYCWTVFFWLEKNIYSYFIYFLFQILL